MTAPRSPALFLAIGLALLLATGAVAQVSPSEEVLPVRLKADYFRYDRRTRILTATGHVVLTADDVVIHAGALVADLNTGEVSAEGDVLLVVAAQSVAADTLTYNLHTRTGVLFHARAEYTGPLVLGTIKLRAERLEGNPAEAVTVRNGFATTCDDEPPILYLTAQEISIALGDKIIGRRVSVWVAGRRLFTLPYFIIFLRERRESRIMPVIGYSAAEGWSVKTSYSYVVNERHYGFIYADWMERLGVGLGVEHLYQVGGGRGSALIYQLSNRQTGGTDLHALVNHVQEISPSVQARLYTDYFNRTFALQPPLSDFFLAADLVRSVPGASTYVFSTYSRNSSGPTATFTSNLVHDQRLSPTLAVQGVLQFNRATSILGTDDELTPRLTLQYAAPRYTAALVAETRWDVDGERFTADARYALDRLPEVTMAFAPVRLGNTFLVAQVAGGIGRFRESGVGLDGRTLDAVRADIFTTVTGPVPAGPDGTFGIRAFARSTWYTSGQFRLFYGSRLEYSHVFHDGLEARVGYTGQTVSGASPFVFDQVTGTISAADALVQWRTPYFYVSATGGYDLQTRRFDNVVARMVYAPRPDWSIGAAASYDVNRSRPDRIEASLDLRLSKEWRLEYSGFYDGVGQRIVHDRVVLTRSFCDCVAVSLTYLGAREEYWLEAWLTAIPWARGRVGVGAQGPLLFDQPFPFWPRP